MREEIQLQLPKQFTSGQGVFLVGIDDIKGINQVKTLIEKLNRQEDKDWIKAEFREQITSTTVPVRTAIILPLHGTRQGTMANMKKASRDLGIHCVSPSLTVGEAKEFLEILYKTRNGLDPTVKNLQQNGNGNHVVSEENNILQKAENPSCDQLMGTLDTPDKVSDIVTETKKLSDLDKSVHDPKEVSSALEELEKFSSSIESAKVALMLISDQLRLAVTECTAIRSEVVIKDEEIAKLKESLKNAHLIARENAGLEDENKKLKGEVNRLQKAFDGLNNIIKGAMGGSSK